MSTVNVGIVSPVIRGDWDITEDYNRLNIVHHTDGATYQAIQAISAADEIDISDTDYWMQLTPKAPTFTAEDVAFDAGGSVENTGTAMAPVLNFSIPRGVTGNESIDDTAGEGDDDVVWSAAKTYGEVANLQGEVDVNADTDNDNTIKSQGVIRQGLFIKGININSGTVQAGNKQATMVYPVPRYTFVTVNGDSTVCNRCCIGLADHKNLVVNDTVKIEVSAYTVAADFSEVIYTGAYDYLAIYYNTGPRTRYDVPVTITYPKNNAIYPDGRVVSNKVTSLTIGQLDSGDIIVGDKKRVFSNKMTFPVGSILRMTLPEGVRCNLVQYDSDDTYRASYASWQNTNAPEFVIKYPVNRLMFKKTSEAAFSRLSEVAGYVLYEYPATHDYSAGRFYGKRMSILGDSLSTFGGNPSASYNDKRYSPAGNVYNYPGNQCRYPQNTLSLLDPHQMYWMQAIDALGMTLGINDSWARSRVSWNGVEDTEKITVDDVEYWASPYGVDRHIASQARIDHLGANGTPDIILVNAGSNDAGNSVPVGTVNYESPQGYTEEQIAALPVDTFAGAYRTMLIRLMYTYPEAKIICMTPSFRSGNYAVQKLDQYIEVMKEICDMFGIPLIDVRHSGVSILEATSSGYLPDGTHYNAAGMQLVGELLIRSLLFGC